MAFTWIFVDREMKRHEFLINPAPFSTAIIYNIYDGGKFTITGNKVSQNFKKQTLFWLRNLWNSSFLHASCRFLLITFIFTEPTFWLDMKMVYIAWKDFDKSRIDVVLQKFMAMVESLINDATTISYFRFHVKCKHHSESP